jgi:hypothetical protein
MRDMEKTNKFKFIKKTTEIQKHRGDRIDDGLVRVSYKFEANKQMPIWIYNSVINRPFNYTITDTFFNNCYNSETVYTCNLNDTKSFSPKQDEGITVKGEKISQTYNYGCVGDLESAIYTIVLHLKGQTFYEKVVKKAITVKTKLKCETCGRKNKSTNKFCFNCGTYLN